MTLSMELAVLAVLLPLAASVTNITSTISLSPAQTPSPGKQMHDAIYNSFSIEFSFMVEYAGNDSHPNTFSQQVIQNLVDISGEPPMFRVGGSTQSLAVYYPDQAEAIIDPFESIASTQPNYSFIGPAFLQSFHQFPVDTKYIFGLNFYNPDETLFDIGDGLAQCVLEAHAAYTSLGDALYAFEIGNEVDVWPGTDMRSANWTLDDYVKQWNHYAANISLNLTGKDDLQLFQGCVFESPRNDVANAEADGMTTKRAKTVSDHDYMGTNCGYTGVGPTIESTIFNRTLVLSILWYHEYLGNLTRASGIPYVLGETNSIACEGAEGISDVMASAIWAVDYVMYLSSLQVDRVHFHMCTRCRYSAWVATPFNGTDPQVYPLYYASLFNAQVFAGGEKQTEVLVNTTSMGAYAVYAGGELESLVAVSVSIWNSTEDATARPYTALQLPEGWEQARVFRLTNPGVDVATDITFAGQSVNQAGEMVGEKKYEDVLENGVVLVGAGEAVLIQL
ncbi:hypothetical protein ASPZODRAFT_2129467 [Penicilliopsis zonata CBS 506.65]|uniref:Beta-glucuronidase C-terminal domain-containing protein n=1 Tax=Penicilliopsis zonata CBS 506.65 TaxID=1073090 RepID=A0A1L9SGT5_9EURO|nr:hypothetical protein ASPZODRAFT_2129467 [Penicilliopsis zonata CBS 506.65]OJJ46450.1 hypothetical protein ASPZODRAFT_2129467 [Penicilliopsis zonata CBS 506.65]